MSTHVPCCAVSLQQNPGLELRVQLRHYEELRDRLDRGEQGWIELESIHPEGRHLIRLEDIGDLALLTPATAAAADVADRVADFS